MKESELNVLFRAFRNCLPVWVKHYPDLKPKRSDIIQLKRMLKSGVPYTHENLNLGEISKDIAIYGPRKKLSYPDSAHDRKYQILHGITRLIDEYAENIARVVGRECIGYFTYYTRRTYFKTNSVPRKIRVKNEVNRRLIKSIDKYLHIYPNDTNNDYLSNVRSFVKDHDGLREIERMIDSSPEYLNNPEKLWAKEFYPSICKNLEKYYKEAKLFHKTKGNS